MFRTFDWNVRRKDVTKELTRITVNRHCKSSLEASTSLLKASGLYFTPNCKVFRFLLSHTYCYVIWTFLSAKSTNCFKPQNQEKKMKITHNGSIHYPSRNSYNLANWHFIYLAGNVTYCTLITFVKSWFIFVIVIFLGFGSPELRLRAVSVGSSKVSEKCTDMIFRGKLFDPQAIQARRT